MTPTFLGRWQTRILLFLIIGIPITLVYAVWLVDNDTLDLAAFSPPWVIEISPSPPLRADIRPIQILCLLLVVGVVLDILYILLQRLRWDRDWPFAFQFFVSIVEFVIVLALVSADLVPFMPAQWMSADDIPYFVLHFSLVFIPSFIALLGFIQIFMIRWRFKGGEWGRL